MAAVGAVISGCEDNSPVAAPTSTLPAADPSAGASTPTVPEYTTDLDLTDDEKKAVDGALVAFEGYIETINQVFSSGGKDLDGADQFARDGSLESLQTEAESMSTNNQYMAGKYGAYDVRIESVEETEDEAPYTQVSILFCTKDSEWKVVDQGEELPSSAPKGFTMQHVADNRDGAWKVANQYLRSKECD
ncbi:MULTISPECIES: hypothetical protein [Brevibacterium]|uniref:Uncharacterized protein n=2 Tax=Actinomycetes TaxID=1760 RepID=A0A7T4DIW5_9MICO|nr:hypothetical protein [Brevibacterium casei]QQB13294.1 hypothetical protein I6H47_10600 [Brevibacterium casei]